MLNHMKPLWLAAMLLISSVLPGFGIGYTHAAALQGGQQTQGVSIHGRAAVTGHQDGPAEVRRTRVASHDQLVVPGKIAVKYRSNHAVMGLRAYSASVLADTSPAPSYEEIEVPSDKTADETILALQNHPDVEYAEPVYWMKALEAPAVTDAGSGGESDPLASPNDPDYTAGKQWGATVTNMTYAWSKVPDRSSVKIAVLDTGVDGQHEELAGRVMAGYDFVNNRPIVQGAQSDDNGHGTAVAGVIAAAANNQLGIAGIAAGAYIIPVKVLDARGSGTSTATSEAIRWAADHGADIINLSIGRERYRMVDGVQKENTSSMEMDAVNYAVSRGVVVIASTGNDSNHYTAGQPGDLPSANIPDNSIAYDVPVNFPAALPNVLAVGAVDLVNGKVQLADFSNVGPEVDVVAPGVRIYTLRNGGGYVQEAGTSVAAPYVSGLAALLKAANMNVGPEQMKRILKETAQDLGTLGSDSWYGSGLIDGQASFAVPRLHMTHTGGELNRQGELNFRIESEDYQGNVAELVYGTAALNVKLTDPATGQTLREQRSTIAKTDFGHVTFALTEAGTYEIQADDSDQEKLVASEVTTASILPEPPSASPGSGTYISTVAIHLTSTETGAAIYYTTDGSTPVAGTTPTMQYTGPFTLKNSTNLKVIAVKHKTVSPVKTFNYTIIGSSSGGGGGGGGIYLEPEEPKPEITGETLTIQGNEDSWKKTLAAEDQQALLIDARADRPIQVVHVVMNASVISLAEERNKPIRIQTNKQILELPPGVLFVGNITGTVELTITDRAMSSRMLKAKPQNLLDKMAVSDLELKVEGQAIQGLNKPVTVVWLLPDGMTGDSKKLGIYYYNTASGQWGYIGGRIQDSGEKQGISAALSHFSSYVVMEYTGTFEDLAGHWARTEVELLAARHVISGVSDSSFAPETKVSRAEFAALLVRGLGSKAKAGSVSKPRIFTDVLDTAWYRDVVYMAYEAGLINGISESRFDPQAPITREQMASMLMRAYRTAAGQVWDMEEGGETERSSYADEDSISEWARQSVYGAADTGLMSGLPGGFFMPLDHATRAQAAVVVKRLLDLTDGSD
ncbi:S8 family serine peptidase [Paenibacillus sp. y28]|uniref:S8 family serine peptidase n=1 Tax=Paenibacillus sp. y28 TaxID=3129110 RepID=UPI00301B1314